MSNGNGNGNGNNEPQQPPQHVCNPQPVYDSAGDLMGYRCACGAFIPA